METTIRKMRQEDLEQVAALEQACFSDPWPLNVLAHELENELSLWLVAELNGTVLGYIGSQSVIDEADMMNLAVRADARRQGTAQALVQALCRALAARGVVNLTLEVRASNEPAIRLYERLGFCQVGLRPNYYYHPKEDARIYRKEWNA